MTIIKRFFDRQGGSIARSFIRAAFGVAVLLGLPLSAAVTAAIFVAVDGVFQLGNYLFNADDGSLPPAGEAGGEPDA